MEFLSELVNRLWASTLLGSHHEGSIFTFLLLISAAVFAVVEMQQLIKYFRNRRHSDPVTRKQRRKTLDPKAPIGWALAPAFFMGLLACVQWKSPETTTHALNQISVASPAASGTLAQDATVAESRAARRPLPKAIEPKVEIGNGSTRGGT